MEKIYNEDYKKVIKNIYFDVIITDPPYPNYLKESYGFETTALDFLMGFSCRQIIFWTVTEPFPLDYTARHIWNKLCGTYAVKEFIYERNGENVNKEYNYQKIKNKIDAQMNRDVITGHPSQKPIRLTDNLIKDFTKDGDVIFDPFMGSGSIGVSCVKSKRGYIGCEIDSNYFNIANKRIQQELAQLKLLF